MVFGGGLKVKRWMILPICVVLILSLGLSSAALPQGEAPKPKVSKEPLTAEQAAVYRALLEDYTNGTDSTLNIANKTYPLEESDGACLKGSPNGACQRV